MLRQLASSGRTISSPSLESNGRTQATGGAGYRVLALYRKASLLHTSSLKLGLDRGNMQRRPASSTPDAGPGLASNSHAGHAFLHDFCMTIPYGVVALLASVVALFLGTAMKPLALPLAGAGVVALACSSFSLKTWKQGQSTAPFTMLSAGGAGAAAYASWTVLQTQVGFGLWFSGALAGLSVLAALFCVYNVLAGGNPPRQGKH